MDTTQKKKIILKKIIECAKGFIETNNKKYVFMSVKWETVGILGSTEATKI